MPDMIITLEVWCGGCGAGLCNQTAVNEGKFGPSAIVEPCETCIERARAAGHSEGYDQGATDHENPS